MQNIFEIWVHINGDLTALYLILKRLWSSIDTQRILIYILHVIYEVDYFLKGRRWSIIKPVQPINLILGCNRQEVPNIEWNCNKFKLFLGTFSSRRGAYRWDHENHTNNEGHTSLLLRNRTVEIMAKLQQHCKLQATFQLIIIKYV